jgi:hypothetical protein
MDTLAQIATFARQKTKSVTKAVTKKATGTESTSGEWDVPRCSPYFWDYPLFPPNLNHAASAFSLRFNALIV